MPKKQHPLLFVDTNIFLDFYRVEGEAGLTLLNHLGSVSDLLIITDQIEVEFLNNRQKVVSEVLKNVRVPTVSKLIPAYLADTKTAAALARNFKQVDARINSIRNRFTGVLKSPNVRDPVFKAAKKVFSHDTTLNLKFRPDRREEILQLSLTRHQRGFPPRKKQDTSMGDAINWEWILACAIETGKDIAIVTRDNDYGLFLDGKSYLNDWLAQEFKDRVSSKRTIAIYPSLAQALRKLSVAVTDEEEKEEQLVIKQQAIPINKAEDNNNKALLYPPFWPELLDKIGKTSRYSRCYLNYACAANYQTENLTIAFSDEDVCSLIDNERNRKLIINKGLEIGVKITMVMFERVMTTPPHNDDVPF